MTTETDYPAHYTAGEMETIDKIREALGPEGFRAYCTGNVLKYRDRAGLKYGNEAEKDLRKAANYALWALGVEWRGERKPEPEPEKPAPGPWENYNGDVRYWGGWRKHEWGHCDWATAVDEEEDHWGWVAFHPLSSGLVTIASGRAPTREQAMFEADRALLAAGYPVPDAAPEPAEGEPAAGYDVGPWVALGPRDCWQRTYSEGHDLAGGVQGCRWEAWESWKAWGSSVEGDLLIAGGIADTPEAARQACDDALRARGLTLDPGGEV